MKIGSTNADMDNKKKCVVTCFVPMCRTTSKRFPNKQFLTVPNNPKRRALWLRAAGKPNTISPRSVIRCCEDHFDMENDIENYVKYRLVGGRAMLKKGVLPHIFDCQKGGITKFRKPRHFNQPDLVMSVQRSTECRICLEEASEGDVLVPLFEAWPQSWDGMQSTIAEDLNKLANVEVSEMDVFSNNICQACCVKLQGTCEFVSFVLNNDSLLKNRLHHTNDQDWLKPILVNTSNGDLSQNVEIKQEVLSDDEMCGKPGMEYEIDIKIEPEEFLETNGYADENSVPMNAETNENIYYNVEYLDAFKNDTSSADDSHPYLQTECLLCAKTFRSVSGLKAHVISQHSYKSVKRKVAGPPTPQKIPRKNDHVCATCKRTFETSTDLMVHETCHNKTVCYICNEKFETFQQLSKHRRWCKAHNNNSPSNNMRLLTPHRDNKPCLQEIKCPNCTETFIDEYYLNIHKEIHHNSNSPLDIVTEQPKIQEQEVCSKETLDNPNV